MGNCPANASHRGENASGQHDLQWEIASLPSSWSIDFINQYSTSKDYVDDKPVCMHPARRDDSVSQKLFQFPAAFHGIAITQFDQLPHIIPME